MLLVGYLREGGWRIFVVEDETSEVTTLLWLIVFVELDFELGFGILDRLHVIFGIHDPIVSRELTC